MNTGKSDICGWLVRPATWHMWTVLAFALCVPVVNVARASSDGGMDNAIVVRAARSWLHGGSPYADPHFLYLPGAVVAAAPQALLPQVALRVLVPLAVTCLLVAGWVCALRIHGTSPRSRFAALGLTALALGFAPFGHLVALGNWTVTAAAALPLGLLCAVRGRWVAAGVVIGSAIALKPLLAPVALLFLFARQWRGLAALVALPGAVSGAAALLMPDPAGFVTRTLPFLLRGHDAFVRLYEASPAAVLPRAGVPRPVAVALAAAAALAGCWCARRRWRRDDPGPLRLVETATLLMLSAFLVSRPSYDHYLLVVLPLLLAGLPLPGSAARGPWFWMALVPQVPGLAWPWLEPVTRRAFRDCLTLCVLAAAVATARRPAPGVPPPVPRPGANLPTRVLTRPGRRG
ncbi:glycosyltransferase family 87 protein [Streptomyces sp. Tue6028]|uniref:glycosyltransferase family 87 protein n=1 Tax=Streptomyces sp. Tue6028 TaxID=2036037 RepID=UPI000BB3BBE3|nr:glycosyltransferase family 87 protein [Streptomyces sp. Tue6028]